MSRIPTLAACVAAALAAAPLGAAPYQDVPPSHWAYKAVGDFAQRFGGDTLRLQGRFDGKRSVSRYEIARVVDRITELLATSGASLQEPEMKRFERLAAAFLEDTGVLKERVALLERETGSLGSDIDRLKMGKGPSVKAAGGNLSQAFSGLLAVGLVDSGKGVPGLVGPAGTTPARTRYGLTGDQLFFTLPQASIALDHSPFKGVRLHVQYDYGTDAFNPGLTPAQGVGINEAYLDLDNFFHRVDLKLGGFALPFQSWEIDGPFRTATKTITPSGVNTFFETLRPLGLEFSADEDNQDDVRWRLGVFTGADIPTAAGVPSLGGMSDAAGLGALNASGTGDRAFGYYLDLESAYHERFEWRVGWLDQGGDSNPGAAVPSIEAEGPHIGLRAHFGDFDVQMQYLQLETRLGTAAAGITDHTLWYTMLHFPIRRRDSLSVRYDDWRNETHTTPTSGTEGQAITWAYNRQLTDNASLQIEWLSPDERTNVPFGAPGSVDIEDEVMQLRYKVWF